VVLKSWRGWAAVVPTMALAPMWVTAAVDYDDARVIDVRPVVETVQFSAPREQCEARDVPYQTASARPGVLPTILGAVVGGALGNALGHDTTNEKVGAAVGAVLGGAVGHDWSRRRSASGPVYYRTQQVCNVVHDIHEEERIAGYDVSYSYLGRTYTTRMDRDPGPTVRVRVQVTPLP